MSEQKKILIVDDEEDMHLIMAEILGKSGYKIFSARNGAEGLDVARKTMPDLIILDIMMPAIDGFKVQEILREDPKLCKIPVVFVTARTALEDTIQAITHGAAGYIEKPFDVKHITRKIESILGTGGKSS